MIQEACLLVIICIAFVSDIRTSAIPNYITIGGLATGIIFQSVVYGMTGLFQALTATATGFLLLLLLYMFGALGAGDVKLFAAVGAWSSIPFVLSSMMYSLLYAAFIGLGILLWRRELTRRFFGLVMWFFRAILLRDKYVIKGLKQLQHIRFPFMYAVLPGILTAFVELKWL